MIQKKDMDNHRKEMIKGGWEVSETFVTDNKEIYIEYMKEHK